MAGLPEGASVHRVSLGGRNCCSTAARAHVRARARASRKLRWRTHENTYAHVRPSPASLPKSDKHRPNWSSPGGPDSAGVNPNLARFRARSGGFDPRMPECNGPVRSGESMGCGVPMSCADSMGCGDMGCDDFTNWDDPPGPQRHYGLRRLHSPRRPCDRRRPYGLWRLDDLRRLHGLRRPHCLRRGATATSWAATTPCASTAPCAVAATPWAAATLRPTTIAWRETASQHLTTPRRVVSPWPATTVDQATPCGT